MKGLSFLQYATSSFKNNQKLLSLHLGNVSDVLRRNEYTSVYNLKKIYPNSSLKITTPEPKDCINETQKFTGYIPLTKVDFHYVCSSGPGGQHVNKVRTKVELRFHVQSADWLSEDLKQKLLEAKKNQISKEGYFVIRSDKTRSQSLNQADVLQRLRTILYKLAEPKLTLPSPETEELIRKRQEKAARERLKTKRIRSMKKESRNIEVDF